ncbi:MAG: hypothetical protein JJU36_17880 [Phycisphaeraceae bacterium]|nr:hypothetical protein [Phycisphaeraceae bacterium]
MSDDLGSIAGKLNIAPQAFLFLERGLEHTVRAHHGDADPSQPAESRHVSGRQLCWGLRDFALQEYGLLARTVLKRWNIRNTRDFGRMVFALIEAGRLQKTDEDRLSDFEDVFDFATAFNPSLVLQRSGV